MALIIIGLFVQPNTNGSYPCTITVKVVLETGQYSKSFDGVLEICASRILKEKINAQTKKYFS